VQPLVESGFLVVAVNYRLAPEYPFPAPIQDVKCAIRSLRANAFLYNIDVNRIGVFGGSAGGQLVSLLGVTDASAGMDASGGYLEQSSRVQAVVSMAGPSDVTLQCSTEKAQIVYVTDTCQDTETLLKYSPVSYISPDDPPFLLLHGALDTSVPTIHAEVFFDRLYAAGVQVTFYKVENAKHVFIPSGGVMQPSLEELIQIVISFFNNVLK
jgi:acetyl esterase/lipase